MDRSVASSPSHRFLGLSRREIVHELVVLLIIVAAATGLKAVGFLYPIERFVIDVFAATEPIGSAQYTALIDIDDESFKGPIFGGRRPLDRAAIAKLIVGAARGGAKVILVDIDTDVTTVQAAMGGELPDVPIVWAAVTRPCSDTTCVFVTDPFESVASRPAHWRSGLTTLLHDGDDVLRRHRQTFKTARQLPGGACECGGDVRPTLSRAAAEAYRPGLPAPAVDWLGHPATLLLNWRTDRLSSPRFPASQVLSGADQPWWPNAAEPMRGKVVVIGGTFREANDSHRTPSGAMSGLEVLAHTTEAELAGGGVAPYHPAFGILLEFVGGLVLTVLNLLYPSITRRRLALNALMVFAVPLAASWLLYRFSIYWVSLAPVVAGVTLHQWYRRAHLLVPAAPGTH